MTTLYLDMDGVVADFDEYAHRTIGAPPSGGIYPNEIWEKLATNPRLYRDLKKTPHADELVDYCKLMCKNRGWEIKFLTAIPKGNDIPWAFYDKMTWALFFFPDIPVMFGPYSKDKHQHCTMGDILIDDRISNIDDWNSAGGFGILHKNLNDTVTYLKTFELPWGG